MSYSPLVLFDLRQLAQCTGITYVNFKPFRRIGVPSSFSQANLAKFLYCCRKCGSEYLSKIQIYQFLSCSFWASSPNGGYLYTVGKKSRLSKWLLPLLWIAITISQTFLMYPGDAAVLLSHHDMPAVFLVLLTLLGFYPVLFEELSWDCFFTAAGTKLLRYCLTIHFPLLQRLQYIRILLATLLRKIQGLTYHMPEGNAFGLKYIFWEWSWICKWSWFVVGKLSWRIIIRGMSIFLESIPSKTTDAFCKRASIPN